jgi:hypothetical protein
MNRSTGAWIFGKVKGAGISGIIEACVGVELSDRGCEGRRRVVVFVVSFGGRDGARSGNAYMVSSGSPGDILLPSVP